MTSTGDIRVPGNSSFDYVNSPIIRVSVGEESKATDFFVHQGLVVPRSAFFSKAMNGSWKESTDRIVPLPEDEAEVFSNYMKLLYTGKLPIKGEGPDSGSSVKNEYVLLSKLYVLAEKLMDETTKDVVLSEMTARAAEPTGDGQLYCPATDSVQIVYEGTLVDSPARQLVVQLYTNLGTETLLTDDVDALPYDFLYDLSRQVLKVRPLPSYHNKVLNENKNLKKEIQSLRPISTPRPASSALFGGSTQPFSFGNPSHATTRTNDGIFGGGVRNAQG